MRLVQCFTLAPSQHYERLQYPVQEEMVWTLLPIACCSWNVLTQYFTNMEFHYVTHSKLYRKFMQKFPDSSQTGLVGKIWAQDYYTLWCVYYWIEKAMLDFCTKFYN